MPLHEFSLRESVRNLTPEIHIIGIDANFDGLGRIGAGNTPPDYASQQRTPEEVSRAHHDVNDA